MTPQTVALFNFPDTNVDPDLQLRLRRQFLAFTTYAIFAPMLMYATERGWFNFDTRTLLIFFAVAAVINIAFYVIVRSGVTAKYRDPSLSALQICIGITFAIILSYFTDTIRFLTVTIFIVAFVFGMFSMSTQNYLRLTVYSGLGYTVMLLFKHLHSELYTLESFHIDIFLLVMLCVILSWLSFIGGYISQLRSSLAEKNEELSQALSKVQQLAIHDELTGTYNRRHLVWLLQQYENAAVTYGFKFAVCLIDIDYFKQLNDTYGHAVGDNALRAFSTRIQQHIRQTDTLNHGAKHSNTFGRYGGEEFILLLPNSDSQGALQLLKRLRKEFKDNPLQAGEITLPITFSTGIAHYQPAESVATLLERTDNALYRAKHLGRDRIELAIPALT